MSISQEHFDNLLKQQKEFANKNQQIELGPPPIKWTLDVKSLESKETFLLDFFKRNIVVSRYSINKRYRRSIVLFRYCNDGRHTNPDGKVFTGRHIHIYREGYDDKFAFPIQEIGIQDDDDLGVVFEKVLRFWNILNYDPLQTKMF